MPVSALCSLLYNEIENTSYIVSGGKLLFGLEKYFILFM